MEEQGQNEDAHAQRRLPSHRQVPIGAEDQLPYSSNRWGKRPKSNNQRDHRKHPCRGITLELEEPGFHPGIIYRTLSMRLDSYGEILTTRNIVVNVSKTENTYLIGIFSHFSNQSIQLNLSGQTHTSLGSVTTSRYTHTQAICAT